MMSQVFVIPGPLRELAGSGEQVRVEGTAHSLADALALLWSAHPALRDRVITERGDVRPHVNIFVDGENMRFRGGLATPVHDGSEIVLMAAVSGGDRAENRRERRGVTISRRVRRHGEIDQREEGCRVMRARVLVSSCLLGADVRYHGGSARLDHPILKRWHDEGRIVPVCPEVAGGLGTPRPPAELVAGDGVRVLRGAAPVKTNDGRDVTAAFVAGAAQAVALARQFDIHVAVLKSNSPSCGVGYVYDGTFSGTRVPGMGVTAAALQEIGVHVFSEQQLEDASAAVEATDRLLGGDRRCAQEP